MAHPITSPTRPLPALRPRHLPDLASRLPGRAGWGLVAILAVAVAAFSLPPYVLQDQAANRIPLNPAWPSHFLWLTAHAVPGGLALALGPAQFLAGLRARAPRVHRWAGRAYMACVAVGSATGVVAALMSTSGLAAQVGFLLLALAWGWSGAQGYLTARRGQYALHRVWMVRNYALTFAAVFLRLFLVAGVVAMERVPGLTFEDVYTTSAWASILVSYLGAEWFVLRPAAAQAARAPRAAAA